MGDSPGSGRSAKRVKHAHHHHLSAANLNVNVDVSARAGVSGGPVLDAGPGAFAPTASMEPSVGMTTPMGTSIPLSPPADAAWFSAAGTPSVPASTTSFEPAQPVTWDRLQWQWVPPPQSPPQAPGVPSGYDSFVLAAPGHQSGENGATTARTMWTRLPSSVSVSPAPPAAEGEISPAANTRSRSGSRQPQQSRPRFLLPAESNETSVRRASKLQEQGPGTNVIVSPFSDCRDIFGKHEEPHFGRPSGGRVNGYVKFAWTPRNPAARLVAEQAVPVDLPKPSPPSASVGQPFPFPTTTAPPETALIGPPPPASLLSASDSPDLSPAGSSLLEQDFESAYWQGSPVPISPQDALQQAMPDPPPMLPQFGLLAPMDRIDKLFWEFYIKSWCPGRSILKKTNLWFKDIAQLHGSKGILAAIQSLAGVYIYDYVGTESIRRRVNERFAQAENELTRLLNSPESNKDSNEVVTIAILLAMQDVILTSRRRKKPRGPRWLESSLLAESFLEKTDPGLRFWRTNNIQVSSLRASQSVVVGRAVIISYTMMPLTDPAYFNPQKESNRFAWLLYGTEAGMYEIHGGCGFSKKLLHTISQVTYCAARLQQDRESTLTPMTADLLYEALLEMRQWSNETDGSEEVSIWSPDVAWQMAKDAGPIINWIRMRACTPSYKIGSLNNMTIVTAETWRIAVMIYLLCRLKRLPRNHPDVVAKMDDLASCIRIMPTSGSQFTAQAPLFPVFLLGMLATNGDHMEVSRGWFESVVETPVRSSVPPLYQTLKRIWTWIDSKIKLPSPQDSSRLAEMIGSRDPWWERLVERVNDEEPETLYLT